MMYQFLTIKDPHLNFGFRRNERLNHESQIYNKLEYIVNYGNQMNIKDLIFTGDVFDKGDESKWSFKQFRLNKEKIQWLSENFKLLSNMGNHDMFFGFESSKDTVFGEMVKHEFITDLSQQVECKKLDDDNSVLIYGVNYSIDLDKIKNQLQWYNDLAIGSGNYHKIVVLHSNITPEEDLISDFTYKWLLESFPNISTFICGHYHIGYPTYKDPNNPNRLIINNWNFNRVVRDYQTELNQHTPEMEHVQIFVQDNKIIQTSKTIKIPCLPFEDAFDPKGIELLKKARKVSFQFFKNTDLQDFKKSDMTDVEMIKNIQQKKNYSKQVYNKALEYLDKIED